MSVWLKRDRDESDQQRLKCLGNVVVPQTGALGMELIQRMRSRS